MSDSQLNLESKTETSVAKAQNCIGGGDTTQKKCKQGEGGTPHILPEQGDKRGGHCTSKFGHMFILGWGHHTNFQTLAVGRVGGWLGGWVGDWVVHWEGCWVGGWSGSSKNNATLWLHLAR